MRTVTDKIYFGPCCAALGYFDCVHAGHLAVISRTREQALKQGVKCAVMTIDMSGARALGKGGFDILPTSERLSRIEDAGADVCFMPDFLKLRDLSGEDFVREILEGTFGARTVVCGEDFRFGRGRSCGADELKELCRTRGIEVILEPAAMYGGERISSSRIKKALSDGDMTAAEAMLGRGYGFSLEVYEEKHLARRLGFPTMNQRFPDGIVCPRFGVYYSRAYVGEWALPAVSNIGVRPTVGDENRVTLETHILDFSGELYGKSVRVELKKFLRGEKKFADADELRRAVENNIRQARELFEQGEL